MNMIKNLDDIRYKKLSLKSEILLKENTIKSLFSELKNNIESFDFKNDIVRNIINNPSILINTARITYDLIMKWKARKQLKKQRIKIIK